MIKPTVQGHAVSPLLLSTCLSNIFPTLPSWVWIIQTMELLFLYIKYAHVCGHLRSLRTPHMWRSNDRHSLSKTTFSAKCIFCDSSWYLSSALGQDGSSFLNGVTQTNLNSSLVLTISHYRLCQQQSLVSVCQLWVSEKNFLYQQLVVYYFYFLYLIPNSWVLSYFTIIFQLFHSF